LPLDYRAVAKFSNDELSSAITAGLRERGILPDPDYPEPWFMCYSHSEQDVAETLTAYEAVVREVTK
jgi:glutamate-1-semialdehyde aminotransferase